MISGKKIQPGEALILFDEIQECPEALNTLDISPLTFDEFLEAIDPAIYPYYDGIQKEQQIEEIFHSRLSEVCNYYFINGKLYFAALRFPNAATGRMAASPIFRCILYVRPEIYYKYIFLK